MTRRPSRHPAAEVWPHPRLDLSSLVDIAFLLLTFFLLTATLDPREADLGFKILPEFGRQAETPFVPEEIRVAVKADGSVWCGGEMVESGTPDSRSLPRLLDRLRLERSVGAVANRGGSQPVIISLEAEDAVSGQRLMDVMDAVAGSGIDSVRLEGFVDR